MVAAQSWHWFDSPRALTEVERLLRPGGALALVWNTYDTSVPWVRDFQDIYFRCAPPDLPTPLDGRWRDAFTRRPGWSGWRSGTGRTRIRRRWRTSSSG